MQKGQERHAAEHSQMGKTHSPSFQYTIQHYTACISARKCVQWYIIITGRWFRLICDVLTEMLWRGDGALGQQLEVCSFPWDKWTRDHERFFHSIKAKVNFVPTFQHPQITGTLLTRDWHFSAQKIKNVQDLTWLASVVERSGNEDVSMTMIHHIIS